MTTDTEIEDIWRNIRTETYGDSSLPSYLKAALRLYRLAESKKDWNLATIPEVVKMLQEARADERRKCETENTLGKNMKWYNWQGQLQGAASQLRRMITITTRLSETAPHNVQMAIDYRNSVMKELAEVEANLSHLENAWNDIEAIKKEAYAKGKADAYKEDAALSYRYGSFKAGQSALSERLTDKKVIAKVCARGYKHWNFTAQTFQEETIEEILKTALKAAQTEK